MREDVGLRGKLWEVMCERGRWLKRETERYMLEREQLFAIGSTHRGMMIV